MIRPPSPENIPAPADSEAFGGQPPALEAFIKSKTKIAIQRDGELTDISRSIFADELNIEVPFQSPNSRLLVATVDDGEFGFIYARNKDMCSLVATGAVDMAIVGMDRLIEDEAEQQVEIVAEFSERALWPVVFATPAAGGIDSLQQVRRIATKYPVMTTRYLAEFNPAVEIIPVAGGAEIYPYLGYNGDRIDGIIDMSVTGNSLRAHNLVAWDPPVAQVYPVLIRANKFRSDQSEA